LSVYRTWAEEAPSEIEVCCVQWPGSQNRIRETPFTCFDELVPALVSAISRWLDRPFAFYGHSLGAKIAFETIRELRRQGRAEPSHLFVGASHAPHVPWPHPGLHLLEEDAFIEGIQRRYGGVPQQVVDDPDLRSLLIPGLRADVRLTETYRYTPEAPLNSPIAVFGGTSDRTVDPRALQAWQHQTCKSFRLRMMDGDHFFLNAARQELLSAIATEIQLNPITVG